MTEEQVSVVTINGKLSAVSKYIRDQINDEFSRYGIEVTNLKVENINYDKNHANRGNVMVQYNF